MADTQTASIQCAFDFASEDDWARKFRAAALMTPVAVALFARDFFRLFALMCLGRWENRFDRLWTRLGGMLLYAFGQKRVLARPFGINHVIIFWSFLVLLVANTEFILNGMFPRAVRLSNLPFGLYAPLAFMIDIASLLVLVAVAVAVVRRIASPPYPEARTPEAFFILGLIAALMLASFGLNASELAGYMFRSNSDPASFLATAGRIMPVSARIAGLLPQADLGTIHTTAWWAHALALLARQDVPRCSR